MSLAAKSSATRHALWNWARSVAGEGTLTRAPSGRVIAVMVNHNGNRFLEASVGSALAALKGHGGDLLVVDNASVDDSRAYLRERFSNVAVLGLPENTGGSGGFSAGMATALTCAECEYIWLLDNDIVVEPGALEELLRQLGSEPRWGAVGSQICIYDKPEVVQEVGGQVSQWLGALRQGGAGGARREPNDGAVAADYLAACSVLIRRDCLIEVGPFRPFFLYYDDVDWGLRARATGWKLCADPASVVRHWFSGHKPLEPWREYYRKRNRALFLALHPTRLGRGVLWIYLIYVNYLAFRFSCPVHNALGAAYQRAAADAAAGRSGRAEISFGSGKGTDPRTFPPPSAVQLRIRRLGERQAATTLFRRQWPDVLVQIAQVQKDGTGTLPGATATVGRPVLVVDDRIPLASLLPGTITWQYLAGELRMVQRPLLYWVGERMGLVAAAGYGLIIGTWHFLRVLRQVKKLCSR
jgi:GT2 family glycosyltransferase